jgi:prepilin-type N-terminal cleavage/methylation domain-containing protein
MKKTSKNRRVLPCHPPAGRRGFSLIELMVVVAIVGIMISVTLISMNATREKKAVETAAREVAAVVREAQTYALTGKGLQNQLTSCKFTFNWGNIANTDYRITDCKTAIYTLKNGVVFLNSGTIDFNVPFSMLPGASTITVQKGSSSYNICIYTSGIVKEGC